MIDRVQRQHSYAMNRPEFSDLAPAEELEEVQESDIKRIPVPRIRRRIQGEALVKFGRQGRAKEGKGLAQGTAPFDMGHAQAGPSAMALATSVQTNVQDSNCNSGSNEAVKTIPALPPASASAVPRKRIEVGQEIQMDGRKAILTWIGKTKFEVALVGRKAKQRFLFSEYPDLKRGAAEVRRRNSDDTTP